MNAGPSGFHNAPVTKGVAFTSFLASIIVGMQGRAGACSLSYQAVVRKLHLWRLVTSAFVFSSTPELMFGLYLLYYFRVLERQIDPVSSGLAPGPYGLIFSSFVLFYFDIPVSKRFRIFGVRFSDKSFVYFAGLQLLLSSWKHSFIPGLCGVLAGLSYRMNVFGIRRIKGGFPASAPPLAAAVAPSEEAISTLVSMGFDRNSSMQALQQVRNDIIAAANLLLEAQSH